MYIIPAEGGRPQRLLPDDSRHEGDPNWSGDGNKIVYGASIASDHEVDLRILNLESHQVAVVPGSNDLFSPRWSPDGRFIAALSSNWHTLKVFDTRTQQWSTLLDKRLAHPAWSKDSRWIYFAAVEDEAVERVPVAGGKTERVAELKDWPSTGWNGWMGLDPTDSPMVMHDITSQDIYALTLSQD
jgi:Tol biopolymer transport system component